MDLKCANPICNSEYEYGRGRLLHVKQTTVHEMQPANWHGLKHYWLCARCSEKFTIEFQRGTGVLLMGKLEEGSQFAATCTLLQAETPSRQDVAPLPPRLSRSRARLRKQAVDLVPAIAGAAEVIENRKTERRR